MPVTTFTPNVADAFLMESIYEGFAEAAEAMDLDALEEIGKEIEGYAIPQEETKKFEKLLALVDALDYDGILSLLGK